MRSAPAEIGGLNLSSLEITCGSQAIYHLVSLFTSYTPSKLILIKAIEYNQLEIGVENLLLSSSDSILSKLATSTWVTYLWEFLHLHCLEIYLSTLDLPPYPVAMMLHLLTCFLTLVGKMKKIKLVNQIRVHLQVYFISDLLITGSNKIKR